MVVVVSRLEIPPGCSTELTHQGFHFFITMFEKYDEVSESHVCLFSARTHTLGPQVELSAGNVAVAVNLHQLH